jgi:hypothetical protein
MLLDSPWNLPILLIFVGMLFPVIMHKNNDLYSIGVILGVMVMLFFWLMALCIIMIRSI